MSERGILRRSPQNLPSILKHDNILQNNQYDDIITTTTNDADLLLLDTTQTSTNDTTTPGSNLWNRKSNHNHKSSSD